MIRYAISDEHYFHEGMITNCGRQFNNPQEMNDFMIGENNHIVKNNDEVYHIGDFMWGSDYDKLQYILKRLNGKHHLILGNHDRFKPFDYIEAGFISVHTALWMEEMVMVHDPSVYTFCKEELGILVHGHIHDLWHKVAGKPVINVSVEVIDYLPISFEDIRETIKNV